MCSRSVFPSLALLTALLVACQPDPPLGGGSGGAALCTPSPAALSLPTLAPVQVATPAPDWSAPHVPGQVLVYQTGGKMSAQGIRALSGLKTQQIDSGLTLVYVSEGSAERTLALHLQAAGLHVQPNFLYQALDLPNDPGYPGNAGIVVDGVNRYQHYLTRIKAGQAWEALRACGKPKASALTAVLDTGVDQGHPDLQGRLLEGKTFSNTGQSSAGAPEVMSGQRGHGTANTGLIGAATNNGLGLAGLTWTEQTLLPVRVINEDGASTVSVRMGIEYALNRGAKVINLSVGAPVGTLPGDKVLDDMLAKASQQAVLVAAAGNTANSGIYYPAVNPNVLAVGAVGSSDDLACYSARPSAVSGNRQLDLVAPGGNAGTGTPQCFSAHPEDLLVLTTRDSGSYTLKAGTSQAAPMVSGVASLIRAANPNLSASQVRQLLVSSARLQGGLPLLDAEAAVKAALK